jgi:predicted alpha/beta-hydrolase family hydrolase
LPAATVNDAVIGFDRATREPDDPRRFHPAFSLKGSATWDVAVGGETTAAVWDPASDAASTPVFVCAHGAGGHMSDRSIVAVTDVLRAHGCGTVRFNFLYRARGLRRPDPMPRLLACLAAVVERVRAELNPPVLVLGGRSMGGRAASVLASQGVACQGLLLLAYPLHPPGQPEKLRASHLEAIRAPVLCLNGTRDPFCDRPLMERVLEGLGDNWHMHWLEGADHSFRVLVRSGRTNRDVLEEVGGVCGTWLKGLRPEP